MPKAHARRVSVIAAAIAALGFAAQTISVAEAASGVEPTNLSTVQHLSCAEWDVAGSWAVQQSNAARPYLLTITQSGTAISGRVKGNNSLGVITGTLTGATIRFVVAWNNGVRGQYSGKVGRGWMKGSTYNLANPALTAQWNGTGYSHCES
jgi:hypothetical protein